MLVHCPGKIVDTVDVTPPVVVRKGHWHVFWLRTSDKLNSVRVWLNAVLVLFGLLRLDVLLVELSESVDLTFLWFWNESDLGGMRVGLVLPCVDWDCVHA